jgi:hypothetical protein
MYKLKIAAAKKNMAAKRANHEISGTTLDICGAWLTLTT